MQPKYQLTDPYAGATRYFDDSQPAGAGYKPTVADYITDSGKQSYASGLLDMVNRGLIAGTAGAPVDIANTLIGTRWPELQSEKPFMGSEWIGQKMQDYGMVSPVRRPIGEAVAGFADPETLGLAAAKLAALGKVAGAGHSLAMLPGMLGKAKPYMVLESDMLSKIPGILRKEKPSLSFDSDVLKKIEARKLLGGDVSQLSLRELETAEANAKAKIDAIYEERLSENSEQKREELSAMIDKEWANLRNVQQQMKDTTVGDAPWVHGTTVDNYNSIVKEGRFRPGKRNYEYSAFGPNAVYFGKNGSLWNVPEAAAGSRAIEYDRYVGAELRPDAKIYEINSPEDLENLAQLVGKKNGREFISDMDTPTENIHSQKSKDSIKKASDIEQKIKSLGYDGIYIGNVGEYYIRDDAYTAERAKDYESYIAEMKEEVARGEKTPEDLAWYEDHLKTDLAKGAPVSIPGTDQLVIYNHDAIKPVPRRVSYAKGGSVQYAPGGRVGQYQLTDPYAGATRYFDDTVKPHYVTPEERAPITAAALKGLKAVEESASLPALAAKYAYEQLPVEQRAMLETAGRMAGNVGQRIAQSEPVQAAGEVLGRVYPNAGKLTDYIGGSPADNPLFNLETGPATAMLPGFFSKLERGLAAAPEQALTSGNAIKQWLSGNAGKYGIKQAEIEATGLGAHLENLGKGKTSKEELLDVVKVGDPGVEEVVKGQPMSAEQQAKFERLKNEITEIKQKRDFGGQISSDRARSLINEAFEKYGVTENEYNSMLWNKSVVPTKYSQYVLPGGENYREMLLTLPEKEPAKVSVVKGADGKYRIRNPDGSINQDRFWSDRSVAEWAANSDREKTRMSFQSPHWDEPNVLAHIRTNDRVGPNGEKQLFVEELQSDWAQKGRKEGFNQPAKWVPHGKGERVDIDPENFWYVRKDGDEWLLTQSGTGYENWFKTEQEAKQAAERGLVGRRGSSVPSAPYITNTKDWTDLGIKRIMQHAAENGYDQVAFINGAQSADRYNLSKHFDSIVLHDNTSGGVGLAKMEGPFTHGTVTAYNPNNEKVIDNHYVSSPDELANLIGQELAEKLLNTSPKSARSDSGFGVRQRKLSGLDLQVGGEGMKKFYDEIVPQAAGKFAKQYGAPFGVKPMETGNQFTIDITPSMRQDIAEKGIPAFAEGGSVHYADGGLVDRIAKLSRQAQFKVADLAGLGPEVEFATTAPEQYFPKEEQHNQRGDAMRHILLQAQLMQKHGENPAKIISWLHENLALGQGEAEKAMDLYNDELGREIGRTSKSKEEMVNRALQAIESGEAHTLAEGEGGYAEGGPVNTDDDDYGQPFGDEIAKLYQGGLYRKGGEVHKYIVTSLTPVQKRLLKAHHAELGDESSFDDWMSDAGIPAIIHGHATKSMDSFLTPEQRKMLDQVNS